MKKLLIFISTICGFQTIAPIKFEITPNNREQAFEQERLNEKLKQAEVKKQSDDELIRLLEAILFSKNKCYLSSEIKRRIEFFISMPDCCNQRGMCMVLSEKEDVLEIQRERYGENMNIAIQKHLRLLLSRSNLTKQEKEAFENIIFGRSSGTITRDGDTLIIETN